MSHLRNCLEESHKDLYQWFLLHQECLLLQKDDYAQQAFQVFTDYLQAHLAFENQYLLSAVAMRETSLRWPINVYEKEHEKLGKMLVKLAGYLQHYYALSGREKRLALLAVLEAEQSFRHVLEHHEQREEQDLFLHLDVLDEGVMAKWVLLETTLFERDNVFKQDLKLMLMSH